nr:MAG TPA: hypothetical protein [Caudoviricetes sp.]
MRVRTHTPRRTPRDSNRFARARSSYFGIFWKNGYKKVTSGLDGLTAWTRRGRV